MEATHFNLQDGREPLSQLDAERKAHQIKLDKLVEEMNQVYVEKVRLFLPLMAKYSSKDVLK